MTTSGPRSGSATTALILDVDGVVSPVHGRTLFGDDVDARHRQPESILVSPTLSASLDMLGLRRDVHPVWLSTWPADLRQAELLFPGREWETIDPYPHHIEGVRWYDQTPAQWPNWRALSHWLSSHPEIRRIAWADDDLDRPGDEPNPLTRKDYYFMALSDRYDTLLIAPRTDRGLTPSDLDNLLRWIDAGYDR